MKQSLYKKTSRDACVSSETTLSVDAPKRWRWIVFYLIPTQSHVWRHLSFSLLGVFSNDTTVSLFRWQLHSKRRLLHPSTGVGCGSDFKAQSKVFHWSFSSGSMLTSWAAHPQMCQPVIKSPDLLQTRLRYCEGRQNRHPANTRNHVVFTRTPGLVPAIQLDQLQAIRVHTGLTPD